MFTVQSFSEVNNKQKITINWLTHVEEFRYRRAETAMNMKHEKGGI